MDSPTLSTHRQQDLLAEIERLIARRVAAVQETEDHFTQQRARCQDAHAQQINDLEASHRQEYDGHENHYLEALEVARRKYESQLDRLNAQAHEKLARLTEAHNQRLEDANHERQVTSSEIQEDYFAQHKQCEEATQQRAHVVAGRAEVFAQQRQLANRFGRRRGYESIGTPSEPCKEDGCSSQLLLDRLRQIEGTIAEQLTRLRRRPATRFLDEGWPVILFIFVLVGASYPVGTWLNWQPLLWIPASITTALAVSLITRQVASSTVRSGCRETWSEIAQLFARGYGLLERVAEALPREAEAREHQVRTVRDDRLSQANQIWESSTDESSAAYHAAKRSIKQALAAGETDAERNWERHVQPLQSKYPALLAELKQQFTKRQQELKIQCQQQLAELDRDYTARWQSLTDDWQRGIGGVTDEVAGMNQYCRSRFHLLSDVDWSEWQPPQDSLPAIPIGDFQVRLTDFPNGVAEDPRLAVGIDRCSFPVLLSFPAAPSLLIKTDGEHRDAAVRLMQNAMLRLLTSLPAGKVRLTIIDPTGLGQNFSAFMHLADYDERLVNSRIWTESQHINQRLADLTEHMENVIQKYLRNEFESIQAYNEQAGEVAEPFQVLVVANFPTNFSEESARRLVSIASSGPRCGVYTLITVDQRMKLPRNFALSDLEQHANVIRCDPQGMAWDDERLTTYPLRLESPPAEEVITAALKAVGRHAQDANRVEVPFASVTPAPESRWTQDSRDELVVPLGRAGATKLQELRLGKGTSQHVLVAGKTGSGKSTLLHALVTNVALYYSPHEVQLYLIDFKKGVEFKPYAELQLPHARVIAIESEREFGLSVLQRLDEELRQRGDLFRSQSVQTVKAFRDARPDVTLPRLLLIVDEFQEFFVKDDRISQEAGLLLDRLVRQGRAFGIHVLLGSQTLAGAYSLARSTIGQMAVRIALQCSETDAHLILSEENTAARLLNRPGEAIYNNANGVFEGNSLFQVVWLSEVERHQHLMTIRALADLRHEGLPPPIVFEGNVAADPAGNRLLQELIQNPCPQKTKLQPVAWLGAAVAIKDPTSVCFRRQSGSHLLIVGQDEESAAGILVTSVVALAASQPPAGDPDPQRSARFVVLDGTRPDSPVAGRWPQVADISSFNLEIFRGRDCSAALHDVTSEVATRLAEHQEDQPPVFLIIDGLSRFRDLKRDDDDFGFSSSEEEQPATPSKQLPYILREGSVVGVHVLMWCDTFNNVSRWFERQTLRDIALRVALQMSANDSSQLIDSAAAGQLGVHRALFYDDERGEMEKFRPYGLPADDWLAWVADAMDRSEASADEDGAGVSPPGPSIRKQEKE